MKSRSRSASFISFSATRQNENLLLLLLRRPAVVVVLLAIHHFYNLFFLFFSWSYIFRGPLFNMEETNNTQSQLMNYSRRFCFLSLSFRCWLYYIRSSKSFLSLTRSNWCCRPSQRNISLVISLLLLLLLLSYFLL